MFCLHVCMCTICMPYFLRRPEEGIKFPRTGVMNGYHPSYGFWELDVGPLQENKYSQPLNHLSIPP